MDKPIPNDKIYFENLDTLRFLAFFTIFASHFMLKISYHILFYY